MEGAVAAATAFVVLAVWLGLSFLGGNIWQSKGGSFGIGFLIVFVLGLIGLVIVAIANPSGSQAIAPPRGARATRECPHCKEAMRRDARVCPHCRMESEPWVYTDGRWWIERDGARLYLDERSGRWVRHEATPSPPPPPPES